MRRHDMRSKLLLLIVWCCFVSGWAVTFPEQAKNNFQLADSVNRTITLILPVDKAHFSLPLDSVRDVYTWGTMSDYKDSVPACRMTDFSDDSCYYKVYTYDEIARPGDSGQPEFRFHVVMIDDSTDYYILPDKEGVTACDTSLLYYGSYNVVMAILPGGPDYMTTDLGELLARQQEANIVKELSDWNLTDSAERHEISNFRLTAGTRNLYRSYHPYYPTMTKRDTEADRVRLVGELGAEYSIRSAISLTGDFSYTEGEKYVCAGDTHVIAIPEYYRALTDSGNLCALSASSTQFYYYTENDNIAACLRNVITFIGDTNHPLPMQIHCAIGADRTGVTCAILSILCGADWPEVSADYHATSKMWVWTYRHPNRIIYALQRMTGLRVDKCTNAQMAAAIRHHLVDVKHVLTDEQIDRAVKRLTGAVPTGMAESVNRDMELRNVGCYDVLGRPVTSDYHGVRIRTDAQGGYTKQVVRP